MTLREQAFRLAGIGKLLAPRGGRTDRLAASGIPASALFGLPSKSDADQRRSDLVSFLKQAYVFEDLKRSDLARIARIVHQRGYQDGEYISEEGKPGAALFVLRSGQVEITRRTRDGSEMPLALLKLRSGFMSMLSKSSATSRKILFGARQVSIITRTTRCAASVTARDEQRSSRLLRLCTRR